GHVGAGAAGDGEFGCFPTRRSSDVTIVINGMIRTFALGAGANANGIFVDSHGGAGTGGNGGNGGDGTGGNGGAGGAGGSGGAAFGHTPHGETPPHRRTRGGCVCRAG